MFFKRSSDGNTSSPTRPFGSSVSSSHNSSTSQCACDICPSSALFVDKKTLILPFLLSNKFYILFLKSKFNFYFNKSKNNCEWLPVKFSIIFICYILIKTYYYSNSLFWVFLYTQYPRIFKSNTHNGKGPQLKSRAVFFL